MSFLLYPNTTFTISIFGMGIGGSETNQSIQFRHHVQTHMVDKLDEIFEQQNLRMAMVFLDHNGNP